MTFHTDRKNTFKKDPLRGLEYNHTPTKPVPVVQIAGIIFALLFITVCFKMCFDKPEVITLQELNSARQ